MASEEPALRRVFSFTGISLLWPVIMDQAAFRSLQDRAHYSNVTESVDGQIRPLFFVFV